MGCLFGAWLARAGHNVTLFDLRPEVVETIPAGGLSVEDSSGEVWTTDVRATTDPSTIGEVELLLVFAKYYHTDAIIRAATPLIGQDTCVLSLQAGWGDAERISKLVGKGRVLVGVTDHRAIPLGPRRVLHSEQGVTLVGQLDGSRTGHAERIAELLTSAGIETLPATDVVREIWSRLAVDACVLPVAALLRYSPGLLLEHAGTLSLMTALLREVVEVAVAQGIYLDYEERWSAINSTLEHATWKESPMLRDMTAHGRTDVDVLNGAIVAAGKTAGIPTPYNQSVLWLLRAQETRDDGVR